MIRKAIGCTVLALVIGLPASAGNRPSGAATERILNKAYVTLAEYVASGGHQIGFRISDRNLVKLEDFDSVLWLDVVTMPGGDMVDMTRELKSANGAPRAVLYKPNWNLAAASYLDTDEGRSLAGMTVADVLAAVSAENPEFREVTGMTSYKVEVALDGRTRSYRAAVLWFPDPQGRYARVSFVDNITQGVENAVLEKPIRPRPLDLAGLEKSGDDKICKVSTKNTIKRQVQTGTGGHLLRFDGSYDGWHIAEVSAQFSCSCEADCYQDCTPSFEYAICGDSGSTYGMCHKMVPTAALEVSSAGDASSVSNGGVGGQTCVAGFGCAMKASPLCVSSATMAVVINGLNVSFQSSGSPDWTAGLKFSHTCSACALETSSTPNPNGPYNNDPNPTGPTNGPAGAGCCAWRTTCYVDPATGIYTCTPTATCAVWGC